MKLVVQGLVKQLLVHILVVVAATQLGLLKSEVEKAPCEQQFDIG